MNTTFKLKYHIDINFKLAFQEKIESFQEGIAVRKLLNRMQALYMGGQKVKGTRTVGEIII